jgi:plasmid stability protein
MAQLTLRVADELVHQLKSVAASQGRSVNSWVSAVLAAAVDPELAGEEAQVVRERLARAGLLIVPTATRRQRPSRAATARARAAAGGGRSLAELVAEDRG